MSFLEIKDPILKKAFERVEYRPYKKALLYKFDSQLRSRKLFTLKEGEIILPTILCRIEEKFNPFNILLSIGDAEYDKSIGWIWPGQTTGWTTVYEQGTSDVYGIADKDTNIFIAFNKVPTKGKGWLLLEIINTKLVQEVR